jgi:hypothetical protein
MPIDLLPLTADWLAAFEAHRRHIAGLSNLLERWLGERLERMNALERRTRAFPIFAFEGLVLSVTIDAQQHGALRAYRNAGQAWAAPFVAFGRGFTRIPQAVEDEMVLPNLLGAIEGVFALIGGSVDRLVDPRASTFDPRNARASDLFGLFAMAWRGLSSSTGQLRLLVRDLGLARDRFAAPAGTGTTAVPGPDSITAETPGGSDTLGDIQRGLTAAIMLLPAIPDWIQTLASAAWLRARTWLLDTFQGIEARVFDLRRQVFEFMLQTLPGMLREVPALVGALATMLQWSIRYFALVARVYFEVAVEALTRFVQGIYRQINGIIDTINDVLSLIDRIMDFDLLQLIKPLMGPAGTIIDMMGVRFTLNDLIEAGTGAVNLVMYATLKGAILAARAAISAGSALVPPLARHLPYLGPRIRSTERMLLHKLGLLEQVIDALFRDTGGPMVETAAPTITPMPNFYDLLFGAPPADLAQMLRDFGSALGGNVRMLFERVSDTLRNLGGVFARTANDLARTGPAERMARFGREAAGMANALYDDQIRALGERIRGTPIGTFERWLAGNGFRIIEAVIPLYIAEMRAWWREEARAGEGPYIEITPTSPHILARRAHLGRVRVPRLTLRANNRTHDETLVRELAQSFHDAVRNAYADGQRRLAQIAEAG